MGRRAPPTPSWLPSPRTPISWSWQSPNEPGCWPRSAISCTRGRRHQAANSCCRWSRSRCAPCGSSDPAEHLVEASARLPGCRSLGLPEQVEGRRSEEGAVGGPVVVAAVLVTADDAGEPSSADIRPRGTCLSVRYISFVWLSSY